jgi:hypothetical protein
MWARDTHGSGLKGDVAFGSYTAAPEATVASKAPRKHNYTTFTTNPDEVASDQEEEAALETRTKCLDSADGAVCCLPS